MRLSAATSVENPSERRSAGITRNTLSKAFPSRDKPDQENNYKNNYGRTIACYWTFPLFSHGRVSVSAGIFQAVWQTNSNENQFGPYGEQTMAGLLFLIYPLQTARP